MKLSEETIRALNYFFTEKDVDRWTGWEDNKDEILEELPILRIFLDKQKELEALGRAVQRELEDLQYSFYR